MGMDTKNKKHQADTNTTNKNNTRTEFADEMNNKATQANNNKHKNK